MAAMVKCQPFAKRRHTYRTIKRSGKKDNIACIDPALVEDFLDRYIAMLWRE